MRLSTPFGVLEGTPDEIARTYQLLAGAPPPPRLHDPPTNELLLHEYETDTGLAKPTRNYYTSVVRAFERTISPKSLLDTTVDNVRAYERSLSERCRHEQTSVFGHAGAHPNIRCTVGLYTWTHTRPTTCAPACKLWGPQRTGPTNHLKGLRHFFAWLRDRGLIPSDPSEPVARRRARMERRNQMEKRKYAPTTAEVRDLARAVRSIGDPRGLALLVSLAKWGRRPGHTLLLNAADLHLPDGKTAPAYADFAGVRDRVEARNRNPRSKLVGNLIAPIDQEHRAVLEEYLAWRARKWGYGPREGALFPGEHGRGYLTGLSVQIVVLDAAMRHLAETTTGEERDRWRAHLERGGSQHISPGCFRHYMTTTLEELGVPREDRALFRGDVLPDALEHYRHLTPERICGKYRAPALLSGGGVGDSWAAVG